MRYWAKEETEAIAERRRQRVEEQRTVRRLEKSNKGNGRGGTEEKWKIMQSGRRGLASRGGRR